MTHQVSFIAEDSKHVENTLSNLNSMRMLGLGCDVVLVTEDGGMFRAHKTVMSWCSSYFRTVFTTSLGDRNCGDGQSTRTFIIIPNVSSSMLEIIIQYAYSGVTLVTEDNVNELLPATDQFNVLEMVDTCCSFLIKSMTVENCLGIWRFGREYFITGLEEEAFKFILNNFPELAKLSSEFLELPTSDFKRILIEDSLNVNNEITVWTSVKRWVQHDSKSRLRRVPKLLAYIRLAVMFIDDFIIVMNDPLILRSPKCIPYIKSVAKFIMRDVKYLTPGSNFTEEHTFRPRLPHTVIFCFGGWSSFGLTREFEVYDCRFDSWKEISLEEPFEPRVYHQCVSLGEYVYIIGGTDGLTASNSCMRFDTEKMKFSTVTPMHEKRCYLSAIEMDGKIYALGGYNGSSERLNTMEYFDTEQNQWTCVAPMLFARSDAGACHLNGRIYVAGGFDGATYLESVEVYYTVLNQWCLVPDMNSPRSGLRCATVGGCLYAIGGCNGINRLNTVEKYDPVSKQWFATRSMKRARSNFAVEVMENKIYVMGGYDEVSDTTTKNSECFDPIHPKWTSIAPMKVGRSGLDACAHSGLKNMHLYTLNKSCRSHLKKQISEDYGAITENLSRGN